MLESVKPNQKNYKSHLDLPMMFFDEDQVTDKTDSEFGGILLRNIKHEAAADRNFVFVDNAQYILGDHDQGWIGGRKFPIRGKV